jgi:hypothetical protein
MGTALPDSPQVRAFYETPEADGVRVAPPPFPAERMIPDTPLSSWPCSRTFRWRDNALESLVACCGRWEVAGFAREFLGVYPQDIAGDVEAAQIPLTADFVIKGEPTRDQYKAAIEHLLSLATGTQMSLTYRRVLRPVIAFSGQWPTLPENHLIEVTGATGDEIKEPNFFPRLGRPETGSVDRFAKMVGEWIKRMVVTEASDAPNEIHWQYHHIRRGTREQAQRCTDPDLVCQRIADQTGLTRVDKMIEATQLFVEP